MQFASKKLSITVTAAQCAADVEVAIQEVRPHDVPAIAAIRIVSGAPGNRSKVVEGARHVCDA